jgi:hypothetical protein
MNICLPEDTGCVIGVCHTPWKRLLVSNGAWKEKIYE